MGGALRRGPDDLARPKERVRDARVVAFAAGLSPGEATQGGGRAIALLAIGVAQDFERGEHKARRRSASSRRTGHGDGSDRAPCPCRCPRRCPRLRRGRTPNSYRSAGRQSVRARRRGLRGRARCEGRGLFKATSPPRRRPPRASAGRSHGMARRPRSRRAPSTVIRGPLRRRRRARAEDPQPGPRATTASPLCPLGAPTMAGGVGRLWGPCRCSRSSRARSCARAGRRRRVGPGWRRGASVARRSSARRSSWRHRSHVHADEVAQLEGAHAKAAADPDIRSIGAMSATRSCSRRKASPYEGTVAAVDDEAGHVGRPDHVLAHRERPLPRRAPARVRREAAGDDLEQSHERRRVEEVHAHDALGSVAPAAIEP